MGSDEMYMENLEEYIFDENRVVTYKWLSRTLGVHVNQAKQMLYTFVDKHRNRKDNGELSVVYFVAGTRDSDDSSVVHQCVVLPEDRLDVFRASLSSLTSCHVYSVQKTRLKDSNALYITDYEKRPEEVSVYNKHAAIQCESAKLRSEEDLKRLRSAITKTDTQSTDKPANKISNGHGPAQTSRQKPEKKAEKKAGIAGMFASAGKNTIKKEPVPDTKTESTKENEKTSTTSTTGKGNSAGGVKSFFSKQTGSKESTVKPEKPKEKQAPKETSPAKDSKGKGKKSRTDDSEEESRSKKRRRIRRDVFESSSEEEDVEMEPESPIPSPPREATPPRDEDTPPRNAKPSETLVADTPSPCNNNSTKTTTGKRRKRTRKLVPKTFMDDDGYMVTEKVWESDSTDASEVEEPPPKQPSKNSTKEQAPTKTKPQTAKKTSPAKGNKQASLTSFFKKK